jgi:hypothetical protein
MDLMYLWSRLTKASLNLNVPERPVLSRMMPIQHVYGPAWSAFLGVHTIYEQLSEIESFAPIGPQAKQLLRSMKEKKDINPNEFTNELIAVKNAMKRFGHMISPFHSSVIKYVEKEVSYQIEYLDCVRVELSKGGDTLEAIIKDTISFISRWYDKEPFEGAVS